MNKIKALEFKFIKKGDLIYQDGPILSHFVNTLNQDYLFYWVDCDEKFNKWLVFPVTKKDLNEFFNKKLQLLNLISNVYTGFVYLIDINNDIEYENIYTCNSNKIQEDYLPSDESFFDEENYEIYSLELRKSIEEFLYYEELDLKRSIFSIRIYDEQVINNSIRLQRANKVVSFIREFIRDVAEFTYEKNVSFSKFSTEAQRYLNNCLLPIPQHGSFIFDIKLPTPEEVEINSKQLNLLEDKEFFTVDRVNNNIINFLKFAVEKIITNPEFKADNENNIDIFLSENKNFINIDILGKIKSLYAESSIRDMDFILTKNNISEIVKSRDIADEKIHKLGAFIKIIEEICFSEDDINFIGKVVNLKSEDIEEDENQVTIYSLNTDTGETIKIESLLSKSDYFKALEAHKKKSDVRIIGKAKRMKTKYKVLELKEFNII